MYFNLKGSWGDAFYAESAVYMTQRCQWTYFVVKNTWLHLKEEEEAERRAALYAGYRWPSSARGGKEAESEQGEEAPYSLTPVSLKEHFKQKSRQLTI